MANIIQDETLTDIADAIRLKTGIEGEIQVESFAQLIKAMPTCDNTQRAENAADAAEQSAEEAYASMVSAATSAGQVKKVESIVVGAADQETERIDNENTRIANENARKQAESNRIVAEKARADAESARVDENTGIVAQAKRYADLAADSERAVAGVTADALDAEAWAVGTMDGNAITNEHQAYNNNAKYYANLISPVEISDTVIQNLWDSIVA